MSHFLAGANVGMFALYVAYHTQMLNQDPIRIIAIEPMQANFTLLQQNMHLYKVRGRCYRCAVGTSADGLVGGKEKNAAISRLSDHMAVLNESYDREVTREVPTNSKVCIKSVFSPLPSYFKVTVFLLFLYVIQTMLYYPRMPGNSCNIERVASNMSLQEAHMNPKVLQEAQSDRTEERCVVFTLSDILHHYLQRAENERCVDEKAILVEDNVFVGVKRPAEAVGYTAVAARRFALLKIDVEGDELEVLQSINKTHWGLVDRVIIESHPSNADKICALLQQVGFCEKNVSVEEDTTGNSFIYASRF